VAILEVAPDVNIRKTAGSVWYGYYIGDSYFCGMRYAEPLTIVFEGNTVTDPTYKQDLDLEKQHFFALSQAEQMECLVKFVQDSINGDPEKNLG